MDNKEKKNNIITWAVIVLIILIAIGWYYMWKNSSNVDTIKTTDVVSTATWDYEDLTITVIDDKRCGEKCATDVYINQLKQLPSIANAKIVVKDFSDTWVTDYLERNNITALPLFEFSTTNFDVSKDPVQTDQMWRPVPKINDYLKPLSDNKYYLEIGATFNPFQKRSEKWFLLWDKEKIKAVIDSSYINGNKDAKITWIEYSDLECPFCAKLHKNGTVDDLEDKYWDDLNIAFNHFPLWFHKNAQTWAEVLECLGEQKWSEAFYDLLYKSYWNAKLLSNGNIDTSETSSKDYLIKEAVELWANKDELIKCLDEGKYTKKVQDMQNAWAELFGITGTPGNVLINNETGEYEIISWAYPTSSFEAIIDKLLK